MLTSKEFMTSRKLPYLLVGVLALVSTGCIVVGVGGWSLSIGTSVWTDTQTERIDLDTSTLSAMEVRSHNGGIHFEGLDSRSAEAYIIATKKAGGITPGDAEDAMDAIEVFVESDGNGLQRVGWRWNQLKHLFWSASVSFDIRAPGNIDFDGQTHNGGVELEGLEGNLRLITHNGSISSQSSGGKLYAETHNGRIVSTYEGSDVTLLTHNGRVVADLSKCGEINGKIVTHNGGVELTLGENVSADLRCRTHNGSIRCKVPIQNSEISRSYLTATLGSGQGKLSVTTHNGSVRIE